MVTDTFASSLIKALERCLIKKNNFHLDGADYDLILLLPNDRENPEAGFSLILSASHFDNFHFRNIIEEVFITLLQELDKKDYNAISRVNILHSQEPFVRSLKKANFSPKSFLLPIRDVLVAGVALELGFLLQSLRLGKLIENNVIRAQITNAVQELPQRSMMPSSMVFKGLAEPAPPLNMGIKRIEQDFQIVYYTAKGLREIHNPTLSIEECELANQLRLKPESYLFDHSYLAKIPLDAIEFIY